jgi:peroxiredoxin
MSVSSRSLAPIVFVIAAIQVVAGCDNDRFARYSRRLTSAPEVGKPAPAYKALTLQGDSFDLADLRGEVVLLNAWATWCKPCVAELPDLQRMQERYEDEGLRVVGVSIDVRGPQAVAQFLDDHGVTYMNLLDDSLAR